MFHSSALVTLLALSASALGFVVQLLLARQYGLGIEVDAYLFALSIPTFIAGLISAMLSYELVPRLVACEKDQTYQKRYITSIMIAMGGLSLLMCSAGGVVSSLNLQKQLLPFGSPIRAYETLPNLIFLAWAIGACQIFLGCLSAIFNARRRYLTGALLALLPYFGMIVLLHLLGGSMGISALPLGTLLGTVAATLSGVFLMRHHLLPMQLKVLLWQELRQLACSSPYTAVAMTCFSSYAVVDAYWAPQAGQGALATLGYAQRLVIGLGNLAVAGPSAVLVPRLAELAREKDFPGFRRFLLRALIVVGGISTGVAFAMAVFAEDLVRLLFGRGSLGAKEVTFVAQTLCNMAPGMVAMLASVITLRALFCLDGSAKSAAALGLLWSMAYFCASGLSIQMGVLGIALTYSAVWTTYFCCALLIITKWKVKNSIANH